MNNQLTKHLTLFAVALMATLAAASPAVAGADGKSYPALICTDKNGPTSSRSIVGYSPRGDIYNSSSSRTAEIRCMIVKDDLQGKGGIDKVTVYYTDGHPTQKISCAVEIRKSNPKRSLMKQPARESSPRGKKIGSFTMYGPSMKKTGVYSHYVMSCTLPPYTRGPNGLSKLHSFSVTEH